MKNDNYIEELSVLWHKLIRSTHGNKFNDRYKILEELSTVEIGIIKMVNNKPDIIFREICEKFSLPKSTLTNIIDRLEKHELVKRVISQRDRRSYGLELTEKGVMVQKEHIEYENEMFAYIINSLNTDEEKKTLLNLLGKIANNLENKK